MASNRRIGSEESATRIRLLDAAADLMRTEGHSAVTVRRLADHAGLKRQLVHYYFRSMEDLFLAVVERSCVRYMARQEALLASANPLRAVWELASVPDGIRLEIQFMSLSSQFDSVRELMADFHFRSRQAQARAVERRAREDGIDLGGIDAEGILVILRGIARSIVMETNIGLTCGHEGALAEVERYLRLFDRNETEDTGAAS